jgi:2-polyprenyl-6-methoxyphenol hydroxylase-like FAD-dependent oxidoreductase
MPSSQWRRYDKMLRFPDGLLVCGDAICSFNPISGEGMTVAALEAVALRDCLRQGVTDLPRRYFAAAAEPIPRAWQMSAGSDLAIPEGKGRRSRWLPIVNRLLDSLLATCKSDPVVLGQVLKVNGLVDPRARLLRPALPWRVAVAGTPGPAAWPDFRPGRPR